MILILDDWIYFRHWPELLADVVEAVGGRQDVVVGDEASPALCQYKPIWVLALGNLHLSVQVQGDTEEWRKPPVNLSLGCSPFFPRQ